MLVYYHRAWSSYIKGGMEELSIRNGADVIEETYGAKIISYTYDTPIENTFGLFK